MNSIQQCVWDAFRVEDIFEVRRGNAKDVTTRSLRGTMALVTAIDSNNAVSGMTTVLNGETIFEPSLTVHNNGNGVGLVFVHNYRFVATSDVTVLTLKEKAFNEYALKFFIPIIQKQRNKFNYGYKLANNRLKAQTIMLPAKNGKPDYAYMEAYMRNVEQILLKRHKDYLTSVMPSQEPERVSIEGKKWKAFFLTDVFNMSATKSSIDKCKLNGTLGNVPYITRTDIQVLSSVKLDTYVASFIIPLLKIQMKKFNWGGNGATLGRLKRLKIMLPIDEYEEPDYAFMSAYMKRLEYGMQRRYLDYLAK